MIGKLGFSTAADIHIRTSSQFFLKLLLAEQSHFCKFSSSDTLYAIWVKQEDDTEW